MIGRLSGTLVEKNPPQILLDVQGVAYEIDVPMSTFYNLPNVGDNVVLFTHLVVREDAPPRGAVVGRTRSPGSRPARASVAGCAT